MPTPPVWLTHERPDRYFVDAEGGVMIHDAHQHVSCENPAARAACLRIVKQQGCFGGVLSKVLDSDFVDNWRS